MSAFRSYPLLMAAADLCSAPEIILILPSLIQPAQKQALLSETESFLAGQKMSRPDCAACSFVTAFSRYLGSGRRFSSVQEALQWVNSPGAEHADLQLVRALLEGVRDIKAALARTEPPPEVPVRERPGKDGPTVSIFMPVYNSGVFLEETLRSIAAQTYRDFEVLIGDDGSTDSSLAVAESFSQIDPRFKVFRFPHRGEVGTRNALLEKVSPRALYLMNHDSDDISLPTKLERLVGTLTRYPEISAVGCCSRYFGEVEGRVPFPSIEWRPELLRECMTSDNQLVNSAVLVRREVFARIGGYREEYRSTDDYDFWSRVLMQGFNVMNVPLLLHEIRLRKGSVSSEKASLQSMLSGKIQQTLRDYSKTAAALEHSARKFPHISDKLNIVHAVENYAPHVGGCELVVQQISERLARRGHYVTVVTSSTPERNFAELNGVSVVPFDVGGSIAYGLKGREAEKYITFLRSYPADVVMSYAAQQWSCDFAIALARETAGKRVNIVAPCGYSALKDAQTLRWPEFAEYYTSFLPGMLPACHATIYHSEAYQDFEYGKRLGLKNMEVIPNGVAEDEFGVSPEVDFRGKYTIGNKEMLLCVGNFIAGKGQDRLIEMFRRLNRSDCCLVLIGREGEALPALREKARGLDVIFLHGIPREDTVSAFFAADLFVFASEIECSPLAVMEAKAAGLPFVSTDCGVVKRWKGGLVTSLECLHLQVEKLLSDREYMKILSNEGREEWQKNYTWEAVVDRYETLYMRLFRELNVQRNMRLGS